MLALVTSTPHDSIRGGTVPGAGVGAGAVLWGGWACGVLGGGVGSGCTRHGRSRGRADNRWGGGGAGVLPRGCAHAE